MEIAATATVTEGRFTYLFKQAGHCSRVHSATRLPTNGKAPLVPRAEGAVGCMQGWAAQHTITTSRLAGIIFNSSRLIFLMRHRQDVRWTDLLVIYFFFVSSL